MGNGSFCLVEANSYVGLILLTDMMCKSANVELRWVRKIGGGMVAACFKGDLGSVVTAFETAEYLSKEKRINIKKVILSSPNIIIKNLLEQEGYIFD